MIARAYTVLLLSLVLAGARALAAENSDLDLIPDAALQPQKAAPEAASAPNQRIYLEDAFTGTARRDDLLVPIPSTPSAWQERLFLDARKQWSLGDRVNVTLSDRFNLRAQDNLDFPNHENAINDFREAYVSWETLDRTYLDVGRINLKSGVALGFNPTDFFKTRAVVDPLSVDPTALREDRLGTFMALGQRIWQGATLTVAFAPKLADPSPIASTRLRSFDPSLDRTNAQGRVLIKGTAEIGDDIAPEFLIYHETGRTLFGANFTKGIGQKTVAYIEWAGGKRANVVEEALHYGRVTGTLPPAAPSPIPEDPRQHFQSRLSVGGSYTTESKITFNLEYHFNEAGFAQRTWNDWFHAGVAGPSAIASALWYIRSYATEQQEPLTKHSLFLRFDWIDAFIQQFELTGFVNTDLYDGSSLAQLTADYHLSNAWTVGGLVSANAGRRHSDFGSLPQAVSIQLKLARYF